MRHFVGASVLLLLAGCDAVGIQRARQAELVGEWDWDDAQSRYPQACGSQLTLRYFPNGEYYLLGVIGTWRLQGNVLTETGLSYVHDDLGPDDIGQTYVSTLQWIDPNTFAKPNVNGELVKFRRCLFWG